MPRYDEQQARAAVAASRSYSEALRRLGLRSAGGNHALFKKWVTRWGIPTDHFDPYVAARGARRGTPLEAVLVDGSDYSRATLKRRLYAEGLKQPRCELCGQGETWRGRRMALVLDHVNGVPDDKRLENLRILCPNCNATLDTHCGRHNTRAREPQARARCGEMFTPTRDGHRYCSPTAADAGIGGPESRNRTCAAWSGRRSSS